PQGLIVGPLQSAVQVSTHSFFQLFPVNVDQCAPTLLHESVARRDRAQVHETRPLCIGSFYHRNPKANRLASTGAARSYEPLKSFTFRLSRRAARFATPNTAGNGLRILHSWVGLEPTGLWRCPRGCPDAGRVPRTGTPRRDKE